MAGRFSFSRTEAIALGLSVLWLAACALYFMVLPSTAEEGAGSLRFIMTLLAIFLPVAMIWVAATAARASLIMRDESARLQAAIDGVREVVLADRKDRAAGALHPSIEDALGNLAATAKRTEEALALMATPRAQQTRLVRGHAEGGDDQPALALGTPAEDLAPPLETSDLIRALNFPESEDDHAGIEAMRRTLAHHGPAQVIQASQDMLTLLSQDGIYMDDLHPEPGRPDVWRRFAKGERGRAVAGLGGVRDRSSLALTAARMREDQIFRDTAHHFLRKVDQMLARYEADLTDEDIVALSQTRTSRAFMLLGRVSGTFT